MQEEMDDGPNDGGEFTKQIAVTFGCFSVGTYRVPFMATVLSALNVKEYLQLVSDDQQYAAQAWKIEELFQREIDYGRVHDIAQNYLNPLRANRPAFFNSLTVVLRSSVTEDATEPPGEKCEAAFPNTSTVVGPVRVWWKQQKGDKFPRPGSRGVLQWNRNQVRAAAIDGQHRLAALKEAPQDALVDTAVSVLFLILHKSIGFSGAYDDQLLSMRSIFIDLNKHAQPVTRARNLLLDDRDPYAACLRAIVSPTLQYAEDPTREDKPLGARVGTNGEFDDRLPLELVDWHGEQRSKVETGPYCTSVLALDWTIRRLLDSTANKARSFEAVLGSVDDHDTLDEYYSAVKTELEAWACLKDEVQERLTECRKDERIFALDVNDCAKLGGEFRELWGRPITRLLTTAGPYASLAALRREKRTLSPLFATWAQAEAAYDAHKNASGPVVKRYATRQTDTARVLRDNKVDPGKFRELVTDDIEQRIKRFQASGPGPENVVFFLTGQRAMFIALRNLVDLRCAGDVANARKEAKLLASLKANDYCAYLLASTLTMLQNTRNGKLLRKDCDVTHRPDETKVFPPKFWAGSIVFKEKPETVDFGLAAAERAAKWMTLITLMHAVAARHDSKQVIDAVIKTAGGEMDSAALRKLTLGKWLDDALQNVLGLATVEQAGSQANRFPAAFLARLIESPKKQHARLLAMERLTLVRKLVREGVLGESADT